MSMFRAKIAVVGPCESGKTFLSNFLGDLSESASPDYHSTVGTRILEFENIIGNSTIDVELWDCGGKKEYESIWPAMAYQCDGVIIVFDPDRRKTKPSIQSFYKTFVSNNKLDDEQCLIFANYKTDETKNVSSPISSVSIVSTNIEKNPVEVKNAFSTFLIKLLEKLSESRDKEELSYLS